MPPEPNLLAVARRLTNAGSVVAAADSKLAAAKAARTTAILGARAAGMSLGQIAMHVGLSKPAVQQIVNRG